MIKLSKQDKEKLDKAMKKRVEKLFKESGLRKYKDHRYPRGFRWCKPSEVIGHRGKGRTYITISKKDKKKKQGR